MAILSVTFHTENKKAAEWNNFLENELIPIITQLNRKYILTEVETEMLSEGKNTNLLLFFESKDERISFLEREFPAISENISSRFKEDVLIFKTFLNEIETNH